jgi:hypothetical protein
VAEELRLGERAAGDHHERWLRPRRRLVDRPQPRGVREYITQAMSDFEIRFDDATLP